MPEQTTDHEKILEERIRSETTELVKQFNERIHPELVEREMSNAVSGLRSASVKDFVPLLASRRARTRLEALASGVEGGDSAKEAPLT